MSSFGGGGGNANPTPQQQQLMTEQALTTAQLNLEENAQRKAILNAMMGTRVFRGSALSRSLRGNTEGAEEPTPPASALQLNKYNQIVGPATRSLLDEQAAGSGATPAGGAGGSGAGGVAPGGRAGGSIGGGGRGR